MMEPMAVAVHALRQFDISRNINVCYRSWDYRIITYHVFKGNGDKTCKCDMQQRKAESKRHEAWYI